MRSTQEVPCASGDLGVGPGHRVETGCPAASESENKGHKSAGEATTKIIDHPAVLDADGTVKSLVEAADPQLNGTYDFNGVSCSTAYDLLLEDIMEYAREGSRRSGGRLPRPIMELAHLPSTARALIACVGAQLLHQRRARGPRQHHHGSAFTGQIGYPGRHGCWRTSRHAGASTRL